MHHALCLEEILLNIFIYFHPADPSWTGRYGSAANLAALARTCRAFKEPALDVLWSELIDLVPLAFCLPEGHRTTSSCYAFSKPHNDAEWDTLKNYTRRVRRIASFSSPNGYLDPCSISATFNSPLPDPLFPNLRYLIWQGGTTTLPVINFAAPLLTSLDIRGTLREDESLYINLLDALVPRCPNIKNIRVQVSGGLDFGKIVSCHLRSWQKLRVVDLLNVALPVDVILYLTQIPTLVWLSFTLDPRFPDPMPAQPLVFSRLAHLEIVSESLDLVTNLLAHIRLPETQTLIVPFPHSPSKTAVQSYLATVVKTCASKALVDLRLLNLQSFSNGVLPRPRTRDTDTDARLTFHDLASCTRFANLCGIHVNLEWPVDLTHSDILALVSALPHIEHLLINDQWGWRTPGITLRGLLQILQKCRLLQELCVAVDARSAVEVPQDEVAGFVLPCPFWLNVADSVVEPDSLPALRVALSALGLSASHLLAWCGAQMKNIPGAETYRSRWMRLL